MRSSGHVVTTPVTRKRESMQLSGLTETASLELAKPNDIGPQPHAWSRQRLKEDPMFEDLLNKERRQLWLSRKIERAPEALAHRQAQGSGALMTNGADRIPISTPEDITSFQPSVLGVLTAARAASGM